MTDDGVYCEKQIFQTLESLLSLTCVFQMSLALECLVLICHWPIHRVSRFFLLARRCPTADSRRGGWPHRAEVGVAGETGGEGVRLTPLARQVDLFFWDFPKTFLLFVHKKHFFVGLTRIKRSKGRKWHTGQDIGELILWGLLEERSATPFHLNSPIQKTAFSPHPFPALLY